MEKEKGLNNLPKKMVKVPPKLRKYNSLTMVVWDIFLLIVLVLKVLKSLCMVHGVTQILKKVIPQL